MVTLNPMHELPAAFGMALVSSARSFSIHRNTLSGARPSRLAARLAEGHSTGPHRAAGRLNGSGCSGLVKGTTLGPAGHCPERERSPLAFERVGALGPTSNRTATSWRPERFTS